MITRFAPTPSGYLHRGNLVNLALVNLVAQQLDLGLMLRIDDADTDRSRPEYVADVFRALKWLGIRPTAGPIDAASVPTWSQARRTDRYWEALLSLSARGADVFCCSCSRAQLSGGRCTADCNAPTSARTPGQHAVRWRTPSADVVLWGRFHPAYHLVSTVDDWDYGITHVVRGEDLRTCSALHRELAVLLGAPPVRYAHHLLVTDVTGAKLSKSQGTAKLDLTASLHREVASTAARLLPAVLAELSAG